MSDYSEFEKEKKSDRPDSGPVSDALKDFDELLDYQKAGNAQGAFRAGDIEIHDLGDLEPGRAEQAARGAEESSSPRRKADTSDSHRDSGHTGERARDRGTSSDAWRPAIMKNAMDRESAQKLRTQTGTSATKATIQYTLMRDRRIAEQRLGDDSWSPKPIEEIIAEAPVSASDPDGTRLAEDPAVYEVSSAGKTDTPLAQEAGGSTGLKSFFHRSGNHPVPEEEAPIPNAMQDALSRMEIPTEETPSSRDFIPAADSRRPETAIGRITPETGTQSTAATTSKAAATAADAASSGGLRSVFSRWRGKFSSRSPGEEKKAFLAKLQEEKQQQDVQNRAASGTPAGDAALRADAASLSGERVWPDDGRPSASGNRTNKAPAFESDGWIDDRSPADSGDWVSKTQASDSNAWIDDAALSASGSLAGETTVSESNGWIDDSALDGSGDWVNETPASDSDAWVADAALSASGSLADETTVSESDGWIDDSTLDGSGDWVNETPASDPDAWVADAALSASGSLADETTVSESDGWIDDSTLDGSGDWVNETPASDPDAWVADAALSASGNLADETTVSESDGWIDDSALDGSGDWVNETPASDPDAWAEDTALSDSEKTADETTVSESDGWIDDTDENGFPAVPVTGIASQYGAWDASAPSSGDVAGTDGLPEGTSDPRDPAFHSPDGEATTEDGIHSEDYATLLNDPEIDSSFGETRADAGDPPMDADVLTETAPEDGAALSGVAGTDGDPLPEEETETGAAAASTESGSGQSSPESYFRKPGTITTAAAAASGSATAASDTPSEAGQAAEAGSAKTSSDAKKKKEKSAKKAKKAAAAAGTAAAATAGGKAAAGKAVKKEKKKSRRRKKKKYKHPILARMLQFILLLFFLAVIAVFVVVGYIVITSPEIDPDNLYENIKQTSVLYDSGGNVLDSVATNEIRTNIDYDQMPETLTNAFVAIEDKTFYDHHGFNFVRIVGAIRESLSGGGQVSGTSTITQQLARNIYLSADRTMTRKIREAYYTLILERSLTKQQILEAYLNTINLGYGAYGVQAAAQSYFGVDVGDLTLAECAALASIPKSPSGNALLKKYPTDEINPEDPNIVVQDEEYTAVYNDAYQERQHAVLRNMLEQGMIDQASYDAAMGEDIREELNPATMINSDVSTYFSDYCIKEVISDLQSALNIDKEAATNYVYNKGLKIYTSLDVDLQAIAEAQFQRNSNFPGISGIRYDGQRNILNSKDRSKITLYNKDRYFNSEDRFVLSSEEYQIDEAGNLVVLRDHRLNLLSVSGADGSKVPQIEFKPMYERTSGSLYTRDGGYLKGLDSQYLSFDDDGNVVVSKTFLDSNPDYFVVGEDTVSFGPEYYELRQATIQPQGAMVVTDYHTGQIKVMIGGRGTLSGKLLYNRAANPRQPGSSIKPIGVYGPALQSGVEKGTRWTAGSTIEDSENRQGGRVWPHNWYSGYKGWVTLRTCVEQSINVTAVRLWNNIGVDYSLEYLKKNGITTIVEDGDANDLNPAALALGGMIRGIPPVEMASAYGTFANGGKYIEPTTYSKVTDSHGNTILENQSETRQVYDEGVAFIMNDILRTTVTRGIASKAAIGTQPVAGKTGTTTDNVDAWFVGQTPQFSAAVWIGNDVNIQLTSGSGAAAALWARTMRQLTAGYDRGSFAEKPDNVYVSGGEYYVNGTRKTGHAVTSTSNNTTKKSATSSGSSSSGSNSGSSSSSGSSTTKKSTGSGTSSSGSSSSGSSAGTSSSLSNQKVLYDQKTGMPYVKDSSGNRRDVLLDKKGKPYAYKN